MPCSARSIIEILQRSIVQCTVPVAAIGIGIAWNYFATRKIGRIAITHFKKRAAAGSPP
jgi:hypothetical protein